MKVCLRYTKSSLDDKEIEIIGDFMQYLQSQLPLKKELTVHLVPERKGAMTTGLRVPKSQIYVLANGRILIDILRTLSHEWVHEFQHQKLGVKDFQKTQDIGGPVENLANILSGIFMKKYQKLKPELSSILYGEPEK